MECYFKSVDVSASRRQCCPRVKPSSKQAGGQARRTFARNLRARRRAAGWSQEALADRSRLHRTYIGSVERGERNISIDNMERLALALGASLEELVRSTDK